MPRSLSVLANVPGLGGFLERRGQIEDQQAQAQQQELVQASLLQKLAQGQQASRLAAQDRETDEQLRSVMQATGGNPQRAIEALLKAGTPKSIELASKLKGLVSEGPKAPPTRQRFNGTEVIQEELQPDGTFRQIGTGPRFSPSAPAQPQAVTPVTIQDPNDQTGASTIIIDARTNKILGKGPKLTQTGSADAKLAASKPQAKFRLDLIKQNLTRLNNKLTELEQDPGLTRITGTLMGRIPNITNLATGAQAKLNSITSEFFVSTLQSMREASKTSGAVGNVSDREGDKMERVVAALDQAQGTPDFKRELQKARVQLRLSMELIQLAFDEQFGGVASAPASPASPDDANGGIKFLGFE